jgi:hypothetical protein
MRSTRTPRSTGVSGAGASDTDTDNLNLRTEADGVIPPRTAGLEPSGDARERGDVRERGGTV